MPECMAMKNWPCWLMPLKIQPPYACTSAMPMALSRSGGSAQATILAVAPVAVATTMGMLQTPGAAHGRRVVGAGDGAGDRAELDPAAETAAHTAQIVGQHEGERREHAAHETGVGVVDGADLRRGPLVVDVEVVAFLDDVHLAHVDARVAGHGRLGVDALRPASVGDHPQLLEEGPLARRPGSSS